MSQAADNPAEIEISSSTHGDLGLIPSPVSEAPLQATPEEQIQRLLAEVEAFRSKTIVAPKKAPVGSTPKPAPEMHPETSSATQKESRTSSSLLANDLLTETQPIPVSDDLSEIIEDDIINQANLAPPGPEIIDVPEVSSTDAGATLEDAALVKTSTAPTPIVMKLEQSNELARVPTPPLPIETQAPNKSATVQTLHTAPSAVPESVAVIETPIAESKSDLPFDLLLQGHKTVHIQFSDLDSKVFIERAEGSLVVRIPGHAEFKIPLPQAQKKKAA